MIEDSILINAPPQVVREIFLDFENLTSWHSGQWILSIESLTSGKSSGGELVPGDKMRTKIPGMQFDQTIQENTPNRIQWVGPWYGLLTGTHAYEFHPTSSSLSSPNSSNEQQSNKETTTLRQWESFTGILSPFMSNPNYMGGKATLEAFRGINADLKKRAEEVWAGRER